MLKELLRSSTGVLDGIKRFLRPGEHFVMSTVNAFGLNFQLRRWLGTYTEHPEHVCFFSPETVVHMLERHGYAVLEILGCYTEPPRTLKRKVEFCCRRSLVQARSGAGRNIGCSRHAAYNNRRLSG